MTEKYLKNINFINPSNLKYNYLNTNVFKIQKYLY